jgi:hypothetical protein
MMAIQSARFVTLDDLEDGDEIEVEATTDASSIKFRKGNMEFILTAHEFSELVYAFICVGNYIDRVEQRRRAN